MTSAWALVVGVGAVTVVLKGAGAALVAGRALPPRIGKMVVLLAPGLLAALIVVQVFGARDAVTLDSRAVGLAAAGLALRCRLPVLIVVAGAAAATALARAAGVG
jgi:branched-subunit amino acid transport protein